MKQNGFKKVIYADYLAKKIAKDKERLLRKRETLKMRKELKKEKKRAKKYIESLPKKLEKISHDHVRKRDSITEFEIKGYCCSCKKLAEGASFQAGHYRPSGGSGILLRYHPWNMHGQCSGCNMWVRQETVKPEYAEFMHRRYTPEQLQEMHDMKNSRSLKIQADKYFYETMIDLYKAGDEIAIVNFLRSYL